jgi:DNA polymerase-3 subunit gamma/tau
LRQALIDELGVDWVVEAVIDGSSLSGRTSRQPEPSSAPPVSPTSPAATPDEPRPHVGAAKDAIRQTRRPGAERAYDAPPPEVHDDDTVVDDAAVSSQELLARELGAEVIDDIRHDTT